MNVLPNYGIWLNGKWVETEEKTPVYHKYSGELIGYVGKPTKKQTLEAIDNVKETFQLKKLSANDRAEILLNTARLLGEYKKELALILTKKRVTRLMNP